MARQKDVEVLLAQLPLAKKTELKGMAQGKYKRVHGRMPSESDTFDTIQAILYDLSKKHGVDCTVPALVKAIVEGKIPL